jgi:hypothetical protein
MNTIPAPEPTTGGRALVVHESMFGNTARIARAIARGLTAEGVAVTTVGVGTSNPAEVLDHDLVVLGAPTHAFSLSRPSTRAEAHKQGAVAVADAPGMREWLERLPASAGGPRFAVFDTRATKVSKLPFSAGRAEAKMVRRAGHELMAAPQGFTVSDVSGPLEPGEEDRAEKWGRALGRAVQRTRALC